MSKKDDKTNVMRLAERAKVNFREYAYDNSVLNGEEVAAALNQAPERVFKTLVTESKSGKYYVFMIPVNAELDLKKAAKAAGEKSVSMIPQKNLFPLTGYIHGGCSPIGMKKSFDTFIHLSAADFESIFFSAGKVGRQIEMPLSALQKIKPVIEAELIR